MKEYRFKKIANDGSIWYFSRPFRSAYWADRWAMRMFRACCKGIVSFMIVFLAGEEG